MPANVFVILIVVGALAYAVMVYRLWRRTGRARVSAFWPQSNRGRARVSLLLAVGLFVIWYFLFTQRGNL